LQSASAAASSSPARKTRTSACALVAFLSSASFGIAAATTPKRSRFTHPGAAQSRQNLGELKEVAERVGEEGQASIPGDAPYSHDEP
jgi:hypothetical protein